MLRTPLSVLGLCSSCARATLRLTLFSLTGSVRPKSVCRSTCPKGRRVLFPGMHSFRSCWRWKESVPWLAEISKIGLSSLFLILLLVTHSLKVNQRVKLKVLRTSIRSLSCFLFICYFRLFLNRKESLITFCPIFLSLPSDLLRRGKKIHIYAGRTEKFEDLEWPLCKRRRHQSLLTHIWPINSTKCVFQYCLLLWWMLGFSLSYSGLSAMSRPSVGVLEGWKWMLLLFLNTSQV